MITMSYGALRSDSFRKTMVKIGVNADVAQATAVKIIDVSKKLEEKLNHSQKVWVDLMKDLVTVENGMFLLNADKTDFAWKDGVDIEKAKKQIIDYANTEVSVDAEKIKLSELEPVKLSAVELSVLEPITETSVG